MNLLWTICVLALLTIFSSLNVEALNCYQCDSSSNFGCFDPFNTKVGSVYLTACPPATVCCAKDVNGAMGSVNYRVIRSCATDCFNPVNITGVQFYGGCFDDGCNDSISSLKAKDFKLIHVFLLLSAYCIFG